MTKYYLQVRHNDVTKCVVTTRFLVSTNAVSCYNATLFQR